MIYLLVASLIVVLLGVGIWLVQRQSRPATAAGARGSPDEVDEELRGVFIAEVKSEIGNLRRNLLLWRAAPSNLNRVMPLRRSFHTLKGSSRMVGVPALGDFNARFERLLDRVIDKSLYPDPPVVAVVEQAVAALPELLAQFEGLRTPRADIAAIMKTADRLIKSERNTSRPLQRTTPPPPSRDGIAASYGTDADTAAAGYGSAAARAAEPAGLNDAFDGSGDASNTPR